MEADAKSLEKSDPRLRAALEEAAPSDALRVVAVLRDGAPRRTSKKTTRRKLGTTGAKRTYKPSDFKDRTAYRKALIAQRESLLGTTLAPTLAQLKKLGVKVLGGGKRTRSVVLEGPASAIAEALELPGLRSAALDQALEMPQPKRRSRRSEP